MLNQNIENKISELSKQIILNLEWFKDNSDLRASEITNIQIMFFNSLFILRTFLEKAGDRS